MSTHSPPIHLVHTFVVRTQRDKKRRCYCCHYCDLLENFIVDCDKLSCTAKQFFFYSIPFHFSFSLGFCIGALLLSSSGKFDFFEEFSFSNEYVMTKWINLCWAQAYYVVSRWLDMMVISIYFYFFIFPYVVNISSISDRRTNVKPTTNNLVVVFSCSSRAIERRWVHANMWFWLEKWISNDLVTDCGPFYFHSGKNTLDKYLTGSW